MSAPTVRKRVRRSAHSFAATPFGIICQRDTCRRPLVGSLAVVPTAPALRYHVEQNVCADSRQDFAAIRRELVADTRQAIACAYSNPSALRATLTSSSRGWFCSWCFYTSNEKRNVRRHVASANGRIKPFIILCSSIHPSFSGWRTSAWTTWRPACLARGRGRGAGARARATARSPRRGNA